VHLGRRINVDPFAPSGGGHLRACAANMKRFGGEPGGKTPALLFDDSNLDRALPRIENALDEFIEYRMIIHEVDLEVRA